VTLDIPLRYDALVKNRASLRPESGHLEQCWVEDLALSNAVKWNDAWAQNQVHALMLSGVKDCWVEAVHSAPSPHATGWGPLDSPQLGRRLKP
jgi:hypothetical protein